MDIYVCEFMHKHADIHTYTPDVRPFIQQIGALALHINFSNEIAYGT